MKTDAVIDHIVHWLESYCGDAGMAGFVVGVSGGIDSAVTSTLCARTGKKVIALNMPIHQDSQQRSLASMQLEWLKNHFANVKGVDVELTHAFEALKEALPVDITGGLAMANTRSRIRMTALYAFSTHYRMLVAGTGNKVEDFGVGFYTKYGDGGIDLSPIADLMKSEVYVVAAKLGILEDIVKAPPTDGLWQDGRTDESQIGATYDELEWAMGFVPLDDSETELSPRQKEVLSIYRRFHDHNRHKMESIPVCRIPDALK